MPTNDIYVNTVVYANNFTKRLYQCCEGVVDISDRPFQNGTSKEMLVALYLWLVDNDKINLETPFSKICDEINAVAIYFFTLDLDKCSPATVDLMLRLRKLQLGLLEKDKESVLSDFRVVFDLTNAGAFLDEEE